MLHFSFELQQEHIRLISTNMATYLKNLSFNSTIVLFTTNIEKIIGIIKQFCYICDWIIDVKPKIYCYEKDYDIGDYRHRSCSYGGLFGPDKEGRLWRSLLSGWQG
jgi:hypothetical protein